MLFGRGGYGVPAAINSTDYETYPEDEYMKELDEDARIWRVYNDEADKINTEKMEGWRSTLDALLIFAGLFSAVVATLVSITTPNLQPDYTETTASLLTELVKLQRAAATGGNASDVQISSSTHDTQFTPSPRDVWVNGLWLTSLALTLSTALITGLVQQWLHFYIADISGSARNKACTRQFRYMGLSKWAVSPIMELLPVLMNTSLLLFFIGLILFSQSLSGTEEITKFLIALTCLPFSFYIGTSVLPIFDPQCPYKTSLTQMIRLSSRFLIMFVVTPSMKQAIRFFMEISRQVRCILRRWKAGPTFESDDGSDTTDRAPFHPSHGNALEYESSSGRRVISLLTESIFFGAESKVVEAKREHLQTDVIFQMIEEWTNPVASGVCLQSLAALPSMTLSRPIPLSWGAQIHSTLNKLDYIPQYHGTASSHYTTAERLSRALLHGQLQFEGTRDWPTTNFTEGFFRAQLHTARSSDFRSPALLALMILHRPRADYLEIRMNTMVHLITSMPEMEVKRVHPWIYHQIMQALSLPGWTPTWRRQEMHGILEETLLSGPTPDSIQEEVLFRCLFRVGARDEPLPESNPNQAASIIRILPDIAEYLLSQTRGGSSTLYPILTNLLLLQEKHPSSILIFSKSIFSVADTSKLPVIAHAEGSLDYAERYKLDLSNPHFTSILLRLVRVLTTSQESWAWLEFGSQRFGTILELYILFLYNRLKILHGDRKAQFVMDHIANLCSEHYPVYPNNQDPFAETGEGNEKPQNETEEGDEQDAFDGTLKCFLRLMIALSHRASVGPPSKARRRRQEDRGDDEGAKQRDILKSRFRGLFRFYVSGLQSVRQPQLHLCCTVIIADRTNSLPQDVLSLLSEAVHDLTRHPSYHDETRHEMDRLFHYFLDRFIDPWGKHGLLASSDDDEGEDSMGLHPVGGLHPPSTERDFERPNLQGDNLKNEQKHTLVGLVEMIARLLSTLDPGKQIHWLELLTSWYRLTRKKHLSSAAEGVMHIPSLADASIYNPSPPHPAPSPGLEDICKVVLEVVDRSSPSMAVHLRYLDDQRETEIKQKPTGLSLTSQWMSVPTRYASSEPGDELQETSVEDSTGVSHHYDLDEGYLIETPAPEVWEGTPFIPYPPRSSSPSSAEKPI